MKISLALLILLLAATCTGSQGMSFRSSRHNCCSKEKFHHKEIPESKIQDYRCTPSYCSLSAVLVKLPQGWVCVEPQNKSFQRYLRKQKKPNCTPT